MDKNANQKEFSEWFEQETDMWAAFYSSKDGSFDVEIDEGYGGYFWEAFAFKMISKFKGIVFRGMNQVVWDDHIVRTFFECNGKEVELERNIELPDCYDEDMYEEYDEDIDCDDAEEYANEQASLRLEFEMEYGIPYNEKFAVNEVKTCAEIYKEVGEKLKDFAFVASVCDKFKIPVERFMQFATIFDFEKR